MGLPTNCPSSFLLDRSSSPAWLLAGYDLSKAPLFTSTVGKVLGSFVPGADRSDLVEAASRATTS